MGKFEIQVPFNRPATIVGTIVANVNAENAEEAMKIFKANVGKGDFSDDTIRQEFFVEDNIPTEKGKVQIVWDMASTDDLTPPDQYEEIIDSATLRALSESMAGA